jgi:hypothetical protein
MAQKSAEFRQRGGDVYLRTDVGDMAEVGAEEAATIEALHLI